MTQGDGLLRLLRRWLYADDGLLIIGEAYTTGETCSSVQIGIEYVQREVAIGITFPSPIEVEETVGIITITNEFMSTIVRKPSIHHWSLGGKFVVDEVFPLVNAKHRKSNKASGGSVAKITDKNLGTVI